MTDKNCPDCGSELHYLEVPEITDEHFEAARFAADLVWRLATGSPHHRGELISTAGLTAALLLKRIAVTLKVPRVVVAGLAQLYLNTAHAMIAERRAARAHESSEDN